MHFRDTVRRLEVALAGPLPGASAHALLAPRPRRGWADGLNPARIRDAASLLLVLPLGQTAHIVLTVRADHLDRHGGQVSLPGGVVEPGESYEQAALREAQEEIGVNPDDVRVLGLLTPIEIPVSGFRLHPAVGVAKRRPIFTAADGEVARILEVSIDELADPANAVNLSLTRGGVPVVAPAFSTSGVEIWGATGMVLAEFLVMLGWTGPPSAR